ncbi:MAG: alpha/beta hydrolase [Litoreibacter sp.]|nr:alpha/beta hydrolase [Litoreibacter sp.]MCY4336025.1 alpha/beta hydrolase [Litoreibacter sp.]
MRSEPALVLHPMLARGRAMTPLLDALSGPLAARAIDLPGHGRAPDWDGDRDYAETARDLIVETLEEPAHLIGHSYGAYLALRLAVDRPDLVLSLTLYEPVFFAVAGHSDRALSEDYEQEAAKFIEPLITRDLEGAAKAFIAIWGGGVPWAAMREEQKYYVTERMPLVGASQPSLVSDSGAVWERVQTIKIPCLLVSGERSPAITGAILDALQSKLSRASRAQIAGAGHMGAITHAQAVASEILGFLKD